MTVVDLMRNDHKKGRDMYLLTGYAERAKVWLVRWKKQVVHLPFACNIKTSRV